MSTVQRRIAMNLASLRQLLVWYALAEVLSACNGVCGVEENTGTHPTRQPENALKTDSGP
jgi:hypothetical protein